MTIFSEALGSARKPCRWPAVAGKCAVTNEFTVDLSSARTHLTPRNVLQP